MKSNRSLTFIAGILLMLGLQSCNLPGAAVPTAFTNPSPDLTLTAIFSPIAPTPTLPPLVQTATALPIQAVTDTPAPTQTPLALAVTNTSAPTPTQTPLVPTATKTPVPTLPPPKPTSTATRAVTPTARPNVELIAVRMVNPPKIDGNLSEWKLKSAAKYAVFGEDRVNNAGDSSGRFSVGWDKEYLYVAARVRDQKYVQNATGKNLYLGDSLEILLDAKLTADYYSRELSSDDFQLGISPGSPAPGQKMEVYLWYPKKLRGAPSGIVMAAVSTQDGYDVEIAIPWSIFDINAKAGKHFGFAFSVSDNDNKNGKNKQESLVSNVSTRKLTDPTTWGDLKLTNP